MEDVAILYVGVPYIKISNKLQCTSAIVYLIESIAGTSFDAAESGPPPLHSVRCPDHFCQKSFPQKLKFRRLKMH